MSYIQSLFLGIVQGVTEFLPVSSSAHLAIFQIISGDSGGHEDIFFDVVLHLGTLMALILYFKEDIMGIFYSNNKPPSDSHLVINYDYIKMIIAASIPTAVIGLLFKDKFEEIFGSFGLIGLNLIVTGVVLFLSKYFIKSSSKEDISKISFKDAFIIGIVQGIAIAPGISRSGITIVTGMLLGLHRGFAAKFSFLISIPAILGALILMSSDVSLNSLNFSSLIIGMATSFISGYIALWLVMKVVDTGKLHLFSYYCWIAGGFCIISSIYYF